MRLKFFSARDQISLMRFLANLPPDVSREKEWVRFSAKVLPAVPHLTILEMTLHELQSFTVNFNQIRRHQEFEPEVAASVQDILISAYEHKFNELKGLLRTTSDSSGAKEVILAAD